MIEGQSDFQFSVRTISNKENHFSEFKPYSKSSENLIYNTKLIDGIKFKFKYVTLALNARHKFF